MIKFDSLGPEKLIQVYNPENNLHGFLVIDNTKLGPAKGGLRITPTVTLEEVAELARIMTFKCALAALPFGGGKSGIVADTRISKDEKFSLIRALAKSLKNLVPVEYITAPDVATGEAEMAEFANAIGNPKAATGKPISMGGLPHELGSTGFGVAKALQVAADFAGIPVRNAKVAIAGFGNVGEFAAKFLVESGAKIVAVSDSKGTIYNPDGIELAKLMQIKEKTGKVTDYEDGQILPSAEIFTLSCDFLIPAALGGVIDIKNVAKITAKIIVGGANLPIIDEAEEILYKKGVLVVPDFVANAGGVISSYAEYMGYSQNKMFAIVEEKIIKNTKEVLAKSAKEKVSPKKSAVKLVIERLQK